MLGKIINNILKKPLPEAAPKPSSPRPDYKRFNDAVLVITQDNKHGELPINACNERAIRLIGYAESEINSLDLKDLLPPDIKEVVEENLEYKENGRGIDEILSRVPNFRLLGSRGRQVPLKLRVIRGVSDSGHITFRLAMSDASLVGILQDARKEYSILSEKERLLRDMQLVIKHGHEYSYVSTFAVMTFPNVGEDIKRAVKMIESSKRNTDIVGQLDGKTLIYIMPDTPLENAVIPLNRFANALPGGLRNKLQIRYATLDEDAMPSEQIAYCIEGIGANQL